MPAEITYATSTKIVSAGEWDIQVNDAGSGHPLILIHGSGPGATGWTNFSANIPALAKDFRVIALTLPGWGESSEIVFNDDSRAEVSARAVKSVMDELGLDTASLIGNSLGGVVALQFAAQYPDRTSHCITMGAGATGVPIFTPGGGPSAGIQILFEAYRNPTPENFRRLVTTMVYDSSFITDELIRARSSAALENRKHLDNYLKSVATRQPTVEELQRWSGPYLIIHGRDDRAVGLEASLRLLSILRNSRLHVFNRCGHWAQVEHANEFNWLVREFIQRAQ